MTTFPQQRWTPAPVDETFATPDGPGPLDDVEHIGVPGGGPEDPLLDDEGRLYVGLHGGAVMRRDADRGHWVRLAHTGGRPLGMEWLPDGDLLVCDADLGLLRVPREGGTVETLVGRVDGEPLVLCNNATVEDDGTIWFTESTRCNPLDDFIGDLLEHNGSGRLLRRDPDGTVEEVLDGLTFANGVTLVGDDQLWVAESGTYSLHRVWRTGPRAGRSELVTDGLPGFPDNLTTDDDGTVWAPLPNPRNPILDLSRRLPVPVREVVRRTPDSIRERLKAPYARVLGFAPDGSLRHDLWGAGEACTFLTGARVHDGHLHLGSVEEDIPYVVRLPVPTSG